MAVMQVTSHFVSSPGYTSSLSMAVMQVTSHLGSSPGYTPSLSIAVMQVMSVADRSLASRRRLRKDTTE